MDGTTLTEYVGASARVCVPPGVAAIAAGAFRDRKQQIEEVIVPEGVREIGPHTFAGCRRLKKVELPAGLESIGAGAFRDCETLASISIPAGVRRLRRNTFAGCRALTRVELPESLLELEDGSFRNCTALRNIRLPSKLRAVGSTAARAEWEGGVFAGSGLRQLSIPERVEIIGSGAFQDCRSLRAARLPRSLRQIGASAFSGCGTLQELSIPETVTSIGAAAFSGLQHPEQIVLPPALEKMRARAGLTYSGSYNGCLVENGIMTGCDPQVREVKIPSGVTTIQAGAFNRLADDLSVHPRPVRVILPEALRVFERSRLRGAACLHYEVPPQYLKQTHLLPMPFTLDLITGGSLPVTVLDAAHLFLFQDTALSEYAGSLLRQRPERAVRAMYTVLQTRRTGRSMLRMAAFVEKHMQAVGRPAAQALCRLAEAAGAGAAAVRLAQACDGAAGAEQFCERTHDAEQVDSILRAAGLDPDSRYLKQVRLCDGSAASPHLVKCLLMPYLARDPRLIRARDPVFSRQRIDPESSQLEQSVDLGSLQVVLADLFPEQELYANPQWFPAYCRFASSLQISAYDRHIRELYADNELLRRHACTALTLSDTREAACRSAEYACGGRFGTLLGYWCHIHGQRSVPLIDGAVRVHLDQDGTRLYTFGDRRLAVRLEDDLTLQVWDLQTPSLLCGPSGWGLAEEEAQALAADLEEMRKRLGTFVDAERRVLRQLYISGQGLDAGSWQRLYQQDPVRRRIAAGLIWSQGRGCSFRSVDGTLRRSDGTEYVLRPGRKVRLAHRMEMSGEEQQGWSALAPAAEAAVDQLGERLRAGSVPTDCYNGLTITVRDKEEFEQYFGYASGDWQRLAVDGRHNAFVISCRLAASPGTQPGTDAELRLGSFCLDRTDRAANQALNLLDDMIIRGRIRRDDPSVVSFIREAGCTDREISRYLHLAMETGATHLCAALLDLHGGRPAEDSALCLA